MAKILNTRLQLRYDTYENWTAKNSPLLEGEIAVVAIPQNTKEMQVNGSQPPQILFKVGPGNFNSLPWASAKAADVHNWAKEAGLFVGDVAGDGNAITKAEWDSSLNGGKGGLKFTKETTFATKAELDAAVEAFGGDLSAITDNDHTYTFSIPTTGDHAGKLEIVETVYVNGKVSSTKTEHFDFVTPAELADTLAGYYTKNEVDALIQGVRDDIPDEVGVMSVAGQKAIKAEGDKNVTVSLTIDNTNKGNVTLEQSDNGLKANVDLANLVPSIKVNNAVDSDKLGGKDASYYAPVSSIPTDLGVMDVDGDNAIEVTGDANKVVKLKINSNKGNVTLDNSSDGLRATVDLSAYQTIANDQDTKYGIEYDSVNKIIKLTNDSSKSSISAADFVKDGMLEKVEVNNDNNTITFTWNTDGESTVTTVELDKLADIYTATPSATEVQVAISNTNQISATLVNSGVSTAKIADAAVTEAKLHSDVSTKINAAQPKTLTTAVNGKTTVEESLADLNSRIAAVDYPVTSVNGKTGAVTLGSADIAHGQTTVSGQLGYLGANKADKTELNSYVKLSNSSYQTIQNTGGSSVVLSLEAASAQDSHIEFKAKNTVGSTEAIGYLGVNKDKKPVFLSYNGQESQLATTNDVSLAVAGKADATLLANYLPLTGGTIDGDLAVDDNLEVDCIKLGAIRSEYTLGIRTEIDRVVVDVPVDDSTEQETLAYISDLAEYQTKKLSASINVGGGQFSTVDTAISAMSTMLASVYSTATTASSGVSALTGGQTAANKATNDANGVNIATNYIRYSNPSAPVDGVDDNTLIIMCGGA